MTINQEYSSNMHVLIALIDFQFLCKIKKNKTRQYWFFTLKNSYLKFLITF